jgi:hypothetical protein
MLSKYCQECAKFISKKCAGKLPAKKRNSIFSTRTNNIPSGLNFCSKYEFDERQYPCDGDAFIEENYSTIVERKEVRTIKKVNKEHSEDVDLALNLSSNDFAGLI